MNFRKVSSVADIWGAVTGNIQGNTVLTVETKNKDYGREKTTRGTIISGYKANHEAFIVTFGGTLLATTRH